MGIFDGYDRSHEAPEREPWEIEPKPPRRDRLPIILLAVGAAAILLALALGIGR